MSEREPDLDDDPRQQQTGQGYQEEQPGGASEGSGEGPDSGTGGAEESSPDTHAGQDSSPGSATGNPGAAGG